jgi:hypothetical protein
MRHSIWLAILLFPCLLVGPARGQVKLQWKLSKGITFYVEESVRVKQTLTILGNESRQDLDTTKIHRFLVEDDSPDNGPVLKQTILAVKENNSAQSKTSPEFLKQLEGTTFRIALSPEGKVLKFEGRDQLVKKLAKNNEELAGTVGALFTEEMLRSTVETLFGFWPGKEVSEGKTWTREATVPLGPLGNLVGKNTYKLVGKEDGGNAVKVTLSTAASYVPPASSAGLPFKITKGNFKVEKVEGTLLVDPAAGRLVEANLARRLKGTVTVTAPSGPSIDMEMIQEQTIKTRVTDKNPAGD